MSKSTTCTIDGCKKKVSARGWCAMHYGRWRQTGSTDRNCITCGKPISGFGAARVCSAECEPLCSISGCKNTSRGTLCQSHITQKAKNGEARPFRYQWAKAGEPCVVCGVAVNAGTGLRRYCSEGCAAANSRHAGSRPKSFECVMCKKEVSIERRKGGRLQRADTIWCRECGRDSVDARRFKKYGIAPQQYADLISAGCHICGATDRKYHIDHDHACCTGEWRSCGKCVRGVLCGQCNQALGLFGDDVEKIRAAALYLEGWVRTKATA